MTEIIQITHYNVLTPAQVGDRYIEWEQGQQRSYLITAVVQVGDTATYWVQPL